MAGNLHIAKTVVGAAVAILLLASAASVNGALEDKCKKKVCPQSLKPCQTSKCNPATGKCDTVNIANDTPCFDNNRCTSNSKCQNGVCVPGSITECTPSTNPCVKMSCNPLTGTCRPNNEANGKSCDDKNPCTTDDKCLNGKCLGKYVKCNSTNPCEKPYCNETTGQCTTSVKPNGTACFDGDRCTIDDKCIEGKCVGKPKCEEKPCRKYSCNPLTGQCIEEYKPDGDSCDDKNACTTDDKCLKGKCVGTTKKCDSGDPCVKGYCDKISGVCMNSTKPDGSDCYDGNMCTKDDKCFQGKCVGKPKCGEDLPCKKQKCNPLTGQCIVEYTPNGDSCDDKNNCTTDDKCFNGKCVGTIKKCDSTNPCEKAYCDKTTGQCATSLKPNRTSCDDGDKCTKDDKCFQGKCVGSPKCENFPCRNRTCNPLTGQCIEEFKPDGDSCDDKNACTTNDKCLRGKCVGTATKCGTDNPCKKAYCDASSGQCKTSNKRDGTFCDDKNKCTTDSRCFQGKCKGNSKKCPANTQCKFYTCNPNFGCTEWIKKDRSPCNDGDRCTTDDKCLKGVCKGTPIRNCRRNN